MFELLAILIAGAIVVGAIFLILTVFGAVLHVVFKIALLPLTLLVMAMKVVGAIVLCVVCIVLAPIVIGPLLLLALPLLILAIPFLILAGILGIGSAACSLI